MKSLNTHFNSSFSVNLEDRRDEIATNDYYLKIYEDDTFSKNR